MTGADPDRPIAEGLFEVGADGPRLLVGRCERCDELHFPRTDTCPYCGSPARAERVGPRGHLRLFTVVRKAPPGYHGPVPFGFGVVALDGHRLEVVTRLGESDLGRLCPELPMELQIEPLPIDEEGATVTTWVFVPSPS